MKKYRVRIIIVVIVIFVIGAFKISYDNYQEKRFDAVRNYKMISSEFHLRLYLETTAVDSFGSYFTYCTKNITLRTVKMQDVTKKIYLDYYSDVSYTDGNTPEELLDNFNTNLSENGYYCKYAGIIGYESKVEFAEIFDNPDLVAELLNNIYELSSVKGWDMGDFAMDHTGEEPLDN